MEEYCFLRHDWRSDKEKPPHGNHEDVDPGNATAFVPSSEVAAVNRLILWSVKYFHAISNLDSGEASYNLEEQKYTIKY